MQNADTSMKVILNTLGSLSQGLFLAGQEMTEDRQLLYMTGVSSLDTAIGVLETIRRDMLANAKQPETEDSDLDEQAAINEVLTMLSEHDTQGEVDNQTGN